MIVSIIVAMDKLGGIGKNNRIPWKLPNDLKRFKHITMGHHILMGRKTWESLPKRLSGRKLIVISRDPDFRADENPVFCSIISGINYARDNGEQELFIIGGGQIFAEVINRVDRIYMTKISIVSDADVFFPEMVPNKWRRVQHEFLPPDEANAYESVFEIYQRK